MVRLVVYNDFVILYIYNTQFGLLGQLGLCMYTCIFSFKLHGIVHEFARTS